MLRAGQRLLLSGGMDLTFFTIAAVAVLAFANGANDVSKGIATLAGSRRASYRQAIVWGTLWTAGGAAAALLLSFGLVRAFTSALVDPAVLDQPAFPLAVAAAASAWVMLASVTGLPVSTTHALTGAIVGAAVAGGGGSAVSWWLVASTIAAPLALSPLASAVCAYGVHGVATRVDRACVCADPAPGAVFAAPDGTLSATRVCHVHVSPAGCDAAPDRWRLLTGHVTHWAAAAAVSFARALNDSPKIAALGVIALGSREAGVAGVFAVTALAMTLGSLVAGLRVARTLGDGVVQMRTDTGLAGGLVTAGLVLAASVFMLPVSTTHVATGAIVGAGVRQGRDTVRWRTVGSLLAAWCVTLPLCAFGAAAASAWIGAW